MKALIVILMTAPLLGVARAQDLPGDTLQARASCLLDVVDAAGQPEAFFKTRLGAHVLASFHYGLNYDLTYLVDGGLLTVAFFEGKAGYFRLITRQARPSAEALPLLLGVDTGRLRLIQEIDVMKVWKGRADGVSLEEVAAVTGPSGWNMAVIKIAGYPHQ